MTAIQILEKLGADASFNPNNLTDLNKSEIIQLSETSEHFNAALHHSPAEEDDESEDKEQEAEDDKSAS
ncbi:hypothetical protein [Paraglaciecola arctica]|uniref:hypothetical protein n=1 Tax=Paraglaciecola arctica TaxID=1128911 RepID=UPI001C06B204|nr:hypothetical protein [Paraglaciecola arctica]MBU3002934.1 hypothetical protein [Paraglaciecola arctica]|tara:strand:+ start:134648 stop:134854 length:207 start_codon:yes stop_codon:yes gene_type:complete